MHKCVVDLDDERLAGCLENGIGCVLYGDEGRGWFPCPLPEDSDNEVFETTIDEKNVVLRIAVRVLEVLEDWGTEGGIRDLRPGRPRRD